ncbi:MAG TPA: Ig-like domain-containing protein [Gemmatimonadaceae bacterium]|nr:Ig-like domain-containing protein [Gemmatimonadaceae bacterium]
MSKRALILAVTGFVVSVAACSSYDGTGVIDANRTRAHVVSVSVTLPSSLTAGQKTRGVATVKAANGTILTDRPVTWFTSSGSVASVTDSGMISAVAPGTAVVSAVSEGVSGQATMAVLPPPPAPVATVAVAVTPSAVVVGQTAIATVTLADSSGNLLSGRVVTWSSSNTSVATVDAGGTVVATAAGSTMIQATSESKTSAASLSVSAPAPIPVASVSVSPPTASLQIGGSTQLSAVTRDGNGNVLTGRVIAWSSTNTGIATVSTSGLVTAVAAGSVSVTASSEGQLGSSAITVSAPAPVPVASVSVSPASSSLLVGATAQLSATTRDASNNVLTGRVVTWSSSNPAISTVSGSGLVTAIAAGSATITALSETKTGTAAITVSVPAPVPVASVSVSPASSSLLVGATVQLSATTRDANNNVLTGRVVTWSTAGAGIALVSANGLVSAVAVGTTQVTATSEGKSGSATITVSVPPPPGSSNEPSGMTFIDERAFDTPTDPAWYYSSGISIVADASAPKSLSNIGRLTYPAGMADGSAPGHTDFAFGSSPRHTVYVSHWGRLSSNWYGDASGTNKICYFWADSNLIPFFISAEGSGTGALVPTVQTQALLVPAGNQNYGPNLVPSAQFVRGQWFHLEIIASGNSAGQSDGSIDWYLDGVHIGSIRNLQFTSGATQWAEFRWYPVWGGNNGPSLPATQYQDVDDIYISGKN